MLSAGVEMAEDVDGGKGDHQETDFTMDSAEVGVDASVKPNNCGSYSANSGKYKHPPEYAGDCVTVSCKTREPVAETIMEVDMIKRQHGQHQSQYYMCPHRPGTSA